MGRKRKGEPLSDNPHTKKSRRRTEQLDEHQAEFEKVKRKVTVAYSRALKDLRQTAPWTTASDAKKKELEADAKKVVDDK